MKTKRLEPLSLIAALTLVCAFFACGLSQSQAQDVTWIPDNGIWKYYQAGGEPPADGSGNTWVDLDFDDSLWPAGAAELGFGDSNPPETTFLTRGPVSFYFRHTLNVSLAQLSTANQLVLNLIRDDGAVVYINGTEIRRDNMPGSIGDPVGPDDVALGAVAGNDESTPVRSSHLSSDVLVAGPNIIAVRVHQNNTGSSDISFELEMLGFEVVPVLGIYTPPAPIDFDGLASDGLPTVEPGLIEYSPIDAFPGDPFTLGFWATSIGGFNTYVFDRVPATQEPLDGFTFGQALVINQGSATVVTDVAGTDEFYADRPAYPGIYRVNLSNFKDVKLKFGMRTFDNSGAGLSSSSRARTWIYTSVDGSDPMTEELVMDLKGAPAGGGTAENLINDSDNKRVLVPSAATSSSWMEPGFNDTSWTLGTKGAGYDRNSTYLPYFGSSLNLKSQLDGLKTSLYMRVPFTVTDPSEFSNLILNVRYDDGFVAYLNGVRVAAANSPGGTPAWNASATGQHSDTDAVEFQPFNLNPHLGELVAGTNVLAIHGMNDSTGSSDMLTGVEMIGIKPGGGNTSGEPETLTDISGGIDGPFHTFSYDIPDQMNTVSLKWTLNCNDGDNAIIIDNFLISGTPIAPNTYGNWIQLTTDYQIDGLGAPDADPDGDLIPNLLEYAFGGSATVPEQDLLPSYEIFNIEGTLYAGINWRQLNLTTLGTLDGLVTVGGVQDVYGGLQVRDITYVPEISSDGLNWERAGPGQPIADLVVDPEETEDVTIDYSAYFLLPLNIRPPRNFVRIKVILDQQ